MTQTLNVNDRFYYTGDMANSSSFGTITEVLQPTKYTPLQYRVTFDNARFEGDKQTSVVYALLFNKGVGQRFKPIDQYNTEKQQSIDYYERRVAEMRAARS